MFSWLKKLFGTLDRSDAASERIALAMEGMASDLEQARTMLRDRLGIEETPAPALPGAVETEPEPVRRNGRKATA